MMTAAEEFRLHAEECLQQAEHAARADTQATLLAMADHWNQLAICMDEFAADAAADTPARYKRNERFVGKPILRAIG